MTRGTRLVIGLFITGLFAAPPLLAQRAKILTPLDAKSRQHGPFHSAESGVALGNAAAVASSAAWDKFTTDHGEQRVTLDPLTGRPLGVAGTGIPWIPGRGNSLTPQDLANRGLLADTAAPLDIAVLEKLARQFLADNAALVRIPDGMELRLSPEASRQVSDSMWSVWFNLYYDGVAIPGGSVNFVVKHGNLILWGTHHLDDIHLPARAAISDDNALALAEEYAGGFDPATDTLVEPPTLALLHESSAAGHGYRRVWEVRFSRENEGSYLARVDAQNGEVLEFFDENDYAQVKGGIYPVSNLPTGSEVSRPLGFANYGNNLFADAGGSFPYTSGTVTSTLAGKYVTVSDKCGTISLSASAAPGDLDFSTNTGTNCTVPAVGGTGNTNSARSCYFHTDLIKQKGRVYLPANAWLQANLTANVNINNVCNAFWSPTQKNVNFYRDGTSGTTHCGNTGEIAAVFLHEWGHGMDQNDGNGAQGSGEAMGDTVAMLQLRTSCIGNGFWLSTRGCGGNGSSGYNCDGYGNCCTSCSGVRDQDYNNHSTKRVITPANISTACSAAGAGSEPCGWEVHCEGQLAGNTVWDLAAKDLPARSDLAVEDAWNLADKLWWESGPTRTVGYACTNKAGAPWNNGCGSSSWFQTFLAADDDDGNLANGTPHASTIFTAFDRHGISCGTAATTANTDHTICPVVGNVGTLSGVAGPNQAVLNWTATAANAATVDIKRNNLGCAFSFTKIASVTPATVHTYTDATASGGTTWYYIVQPINSNVDCLGPASNCVSVTPTVSTCSAPTGVSAPTVADVSACAASGITVTWAAPTAWGDTSGTRTWTVLRNGVAVASGPCTGAIAGTTLTCTDTSAVAGTAYTYTVKANNGCGSSTTSAASASVTDLQGAVPSGFANNSAADINACSATGNSVTWTAPTGWNDNGSGARTYTVLRGGVAVASGPCFGALSAATVTCNDTSAVAGTAYTYTVRANNGCALQTTTTPGASATDAVGVAPSGVNAPTVGDASACTASGINVTWVAPTWGGAAGTYVILRDGTAVVGGACAGNIPAATLTCLDTTAAAGAHTYQVRATNGCALATTSVASASVSDLAGAVPSGFANNSAADINACSATGNSVTWTAPTGWNDNGSGARTYTVLRGGVAVASGPCFGALSAATVTCNDTSAVAGTAYTYTVRANNGCALQTTTTPGASATDLTSSAPSAFANNSAADANACTATGNLVSWTPPTWNDNGSGVRTYTVLRGGVAVASGSCSGPLTAATVNCTDSSAAGGTAYTYTVRANDGCGNQTATAPGASATDLSDSTAPASPAQTVAKASPNINFSWPSVPTTANYLSYSAATPNPATWNLRNTTAALAWSDGADLAGATSFFYTTTARDTCLNESPK